MRLEARRLHALPVIERTDGNESRAKVSTAPRSARRPPAKISPTRRFTWSAGLFLLVQGVSTFSLLTYPTLDRHFPLLLASTRMVKPHSLLHVASGLLAIGVLVWTGRRCSIWFAAGFGSFYLGLGLAGLLFDSPSSLEMQSFDHPFHLLLGGLGVLAASREYRLLRSVKGEVQ